MRRVVGMSVLVMAFLILGGVAFAQEKTPGINVDVGWRFWFLTQDKIQGDKVSGGWLAGPAVSVDLDRKWVLGFSYLTTESGTGGESLDPVRTRPRNKAIEHDTQRSDMDVSLRYRLIEPLGVYINFKRLEEEFNNRAGTALFHGTLMGIGFGVAGSYGLWSPTEKSSLFLTGSGGYLPLAWEEFTGGTNERTTNEWFTLEVGAGYAHSVGPTLLSVVLGYRWQTLAVENTRGATTFDHTTVDFYGPTLSLNVRW